MKLLRITGRILNTDNIVYAQVHPSTMSVMVAGYDRMITISGDDYRLVLDAICEASFVGENFMVNPARIGLINEEGANARVYLDGADRPVLLPLSTFDTLSSAGKISEMPIGPMAEAELIVLEPKSTKRRNSSSGGTVVPAERPNR